ncbi:MAG: hypothetical protein M3Z41_09330 [Candidatus Eremiobacteraeota bacterium]|nr:hypothetical protein [Candidatus Eremiobacteraeota bacterium]
MLAHLPPALPQVVRRCAAWLGPRRVPAIGVGLVLAILLVAAMAGSKMSVQTSLFSAPLHASQAIEVERALTIWNEPFAADAQHTQIFVGASRRRDVLLRLTLAGLPHRYVPTSSDVLDLPQSAFVPQAVVDDRRRAGIEGDLVSGLRRINGVADATVVIAPAVDDPLADSDARAPASASVQIVMQSGAQLSSTAVSGIKRFVAASYAGLAADRVVVVDGSGASLGAQTVADRASSREMRLQGSIQSALDEVFGVGAAIVRVSVRNAGEDRSAQSTRVTPHGLLEADSGKERGSENGRRFEKERDRRRYAYDTITETRTARADAVGRVAVAVFLDAHKIGLDQSKLVADLVRAAAGADLASGDDIVVQALPFRAAASALAPPIRAPGFDTIVAPAIVIVGVAVLGTFLLKQHMTVYRRPEVDAGIAVHARLQYELPQTAAYVLASMPTRVRDQVLREYPTEQRERILRYLNGRPHG